MRSGLSLLSAAKIAHVGLKHVFQLRLRYRDGQENCSASLPENPSTDPSTAQHNIFSGSSHCLPGEVSGQSLYSQHEMSQTPKEPALVCDTFPNYPPS